ncbi:alpha/beta fold hydrolase [Haloglycomyces albus]|uniref:alpha/beta fold hydrolase n=1 Tax=Haloglycomyces albus TaxID=526067 RepID=UPI00046C9DB7|nr:alpha/beta hydrolase [Haloglycomyces albus]
MSDEQPIVLRRESSGAADAPTVLFLHGLASDTQTWSDVSDGLGRFRLWSAELPWRSEGVADWAVEHDPAVWLDRTAAQLNERIDVVVAHSFAATLALDWLTRPETTVTPRALVVVSPFYRAAARDFDWAAIDYYFNNFHQILAEGIHDRSRRPIPADIAEDMARHVRDRIGPYAWMRFFDAYTRTPSLPLERWDTPTLIMAGRHDRAAFLRDAEALDAVLRRSRLQVFDDCAHFPMHENTHEFHKTLTEFIDLALTDQE